MRRPRLAAGSATLFLALLLAACATPLQWGSIPADLSSVGKAGWVQDLETLKSEMLLHPKLSADSATRLRFLAALESLEQGISEAEDNSALAETAIAGIHEALATVEDGHSRINASPEDVFPLILKYFPASPEAREAGLSLYDGWEARIAATDSAHREYLGSIVTKIGGRNLAEATELLSDYLSIEAGVRGEGREDLYGHAVRTEIMDSFSDARLMGGSGLAANGRLELEIWDSSLGSRALGLEAGPGQGWVSVLGDLPEVSRPFTRGRPGEPWWHATVPSAPGVLYFRYDSCDSEAKSTMDEVLALLPGRESGETTQKLIIDLRFNSGGDSRPGYAFARGLSTKQVAHLKGGVIILTGGATFSSALMNAADILKACGASGAQPGNAVLVGEPLIEPMRHYGHITRFALPNSGIIVGRSRRLWNYDSMTGIYPARGILEPAPENLAHQDYADYSSGVDTTFERALVLASGV